MKSRFLKVESPPDSLAETGARLELVDVRLAERYGKPEWASHGSPLDELIATVLSQHTSDINTARAYSALRAQFPEWSDVASASTDDVVLAIRSGGLANIKAPRIQRILSELDARFGTLGLEFLADQGLEEARRWLVSLPGVGLKTASCVLLFSLGLPAMPVDTHVLRVSRRLGLIAPKVTADAAHHALESLIGPNRDRVYRLHLNFIQHGRTICKARTPLCGTCVLADECPSARI